MSDRYVLNKCEDMVFDTHSDEEVSPSDCATLMNGLLVRITDLDCVYLELMKRRREVRNMQKEIEPLNQKIIELKKLN